jgi:hypothetical protein
MNFQREVARTSGEGDSIRKLVSRNPVKRLKFCPSQFALSFELRGAPQKAFSAEMHRTRRKQDKTQTLDKFKKRNLAAQIKKPVPSIFFYAPLAATVGAAC